MKATRSNRLTRVLALVTARMLLPLLLWVLPAVAQDQFNYMENNGTITITGYTGPGGAVTIPDTISGLPVTSIGDDAFFYCTSLTSVTIPDSVTIIRLVAFSYCTSMTNVTIGKGVTGITDFAFIGCTSLTAITVDALNPVFSSVDGVLFNKSQTVLIQYAGGKAGSYTVPNSVTFIGDGAFFGRSSLTNVTMPNGVEYIGWNAFEYCTGLTSVTIPDSVGSIGIYSFAFCTNLTSVTIPDSVGSIGDSAFWNCTSLTSVTIGSGVSYIRDGAFQHCISLQGVYFQGNAPGVGELVFYDDNNATVYYLPGTMGWSPTFCGRPTVQWQPPVADARATQPMVISANGIDAKVVLDGTRSFSPEGDPLQYQWFEAGSEILLATGAVAVVVLPVGTHPIDLVVSDRIATSTNQVGVTVLTTSQAVQRLISMVNGSGIAHPNPLTATLDAALGSLSRGNVVAAANQLRAFQNKVQAQVAPKDPLLADTLTRAAQQVIDALER